MMMVPGMTAGPAGWNSTPVTAAAAVAVVGCEGVAAGSSQRSSVTCRLNRAAGYACIWNTRIPGAADFCVLLAGPESEYAYSKSV